MVSQCRLERGQEEERQPPTEHGLRRVAAATRELQATVRIGEPWSGDADFLVREPLAWAGPFENIVVDSWDTGFKVFPGQVLGSMIRGGTVELGMGRAVATAAIYTAIAAVTALVLVSRRDVTA